MPRSVLGGWNMVIECGMILVKLQIMYAIEDYLAGSIEKEFLIVARYYEMFRSRRLIITY